MRAYLLRGVDYLWGKRPAILIFLGLLGIDILVGLAYTSMGFWIVIGALVALGATVFLFSSVRSLLLLVFVAMPLIDMLWFAGIGVAGFTLNAQSVLSVVVVFATLMAIATQRIEMPRRLLAPMLVVLVLNLYALAITSSLPYGVEYLLRLFCGFPLVFVVPTVIDRLPSPGRLLQLFFVVMGIVCLTVLLQPLHVIPYTSFDESGLGRATGFYYHPWDVARYMVIVIPMLFAVLDEPGREKILRHWPYWGLLALSLVTTFVTFLKAAWIAVLFQVLLWLFLTGRRRMAFVVLATTIILVAFPLRAGFVSVFSDLWKLSSKATAGQALSGRIFVWSEYLKGIRQGGLRSALLGQGYLPESLGTTRRATHDDYLRILVMNGIVGLIAYFALLGATLRAVIQAVRRLALHGGLEYRIGLAVECLLAAFILMGITADPSSYPSLTLYLWLLVGLVLGYAKREAERATPVTQSPAKA